MQTTPSRTQGVDLSRYIDTSIHKLVVIVIVIFALLLQSVPAFAHTIGNSDEAAHAKDDLTDMTISEIERKTNENKQKILQNKNIDTGAARSKDTVSTDKTFSSQAVSNNPGVSGKWSSVLKTPIVPVFQAVLPNGKVLIWDSVGDKATEEYANHTYTRAMVWDPKDNTSRRVDVKGYNIFCAGFAHLPNGDILVAGGNKNDNLHGIVQTHIFNWQTETWSRGADMKSDRWYPSLAAMANGEVAIIGGGPAVTEVYQTNGDIRQLPRVADATYGKRIYPFMASRPDTLLQMLGPYDMMYTASIPGLGKIVDSDKRDGKNRQYGSFATYDIGKHLMVGGGGRLSGTKWRAPTRTVHSVDTNKWQNTTVESKSWVPSGEGRRQHNATVLADGTVLVTGGMTSTQNSGLVDLDNAITSATNWNPATDEWTTLSSASRIRQYHSTAALLPDGRVMTGGGGICGQCMDQGYLEKNIEYFSPPYLYKKDGSGQLANRPVITSAPSSVSINQRFTIRVSTNVKDIRKVGLIGLGDVTHSVDQGQKYIPLKYDAYTKHIRARGPATGGIAPPGYYMLTVTDNSGVPSVAEIVKVNKSPGPIMTPIKNVGAKRCIDLPRQSLEIKTYLWSYRCNDTGAQAMTRFLDDGTIRVLGNCFDVPKRNFKSNQKIWSYRCNGTEAQQWQFRSDGTIRPTSKTSLCLTPYSTSIRASIRIRTCDGTSLQKWNW